MNCNDVEQLIDLYLDDALSEEARARVERHALRCADCAFRIRSLEQTLAMLREALPPVDASPSFRERMAARLEDAFQEMLRPEEAEAGQRSLPFPV